MSSVHDTGMAVSAAIAVAHALTEKAKTELGTGVIQLPADDEKLARIADRVLEHGQHISHALAQEIQKHRKILFEIQNATDRKTSELVGRHQIEMGDLHDQLKALHEQLESVNQTTTNLAEAQLTTKPALPLDWEFKFSPTKKGLLLYKRSDEKEWRYQNLIPDIAAAIARYDVGSGCGPEEVVALARDKASLNVRFGDIVVSDKTMIANFVGGGVSVTNPATGVARININAATEGLAFVGNTDATARLSTVYGTAITNAAGDFTFAFDQVPISSVVHVDATAAPLTTVGLTSPERVVDARCTVVGQTITGTAFVRKKVYSLIGTSSEATVPAPAGIVIKIRIAGVAV